jgi:hypothetical protein
LNYFKAHLFILSQIGKPAMSDATHRRATGPTNPDVWDVFKAYFNIEYYTFHLNAEMTKITCT